MVKVRLKHIKRVRKHLASGEVKTYFYHQKTGRPITGKPGSDEFLASYREASLHAPHRSDTFGGLVSLFQGSPEFSALSQRTKVEYLRYMDELRDRFGSMPLKVLEDRRVRDDFFEWRDERADTPRRADAGWSVLRRILSYAYERGKLSVNHATNPKALYKNDRSDKVWLPQHIEAFCAHAEDELQWALALALYTGQRQGDLLALTWTQIETRADKKWITLRQNKTGKRVAIPVHHTLQVILENIPKRAAVVLTTKTKRPWTSRHFGKQWKRATDRSGLVDLRFHDLRGTAVTMLSEAGATPQEIAAITGHSLRTVSTILDKYLARTHNLALAAIAKLENKEQSKLETAPEFLETGPETKIRHLK